MADCSASTIDIAGKIRRSDIGRLAAAIERDRASLDWGDAIDSDEAEREIFAAAAEKRSLRLTRCEARWGELPEIEEASRELRLAYVAQCDAGADWPATIRYWTPGSLEAREWTIGAIGEEPMLAFSAIEGHLAATGKAHGLNDHGTLEEELALMKKAHSFDPPLEIVADEP